MKRRKFIAGLASAAVWPVVGRGQQMRVPVIGFLGGGSQYDDANRVRAFRQGLSEMGYVEGKNVVIEYRWAEGNFDRFPSLAADLVRRRVTVITAPGSTNAALAAKAATTTIPIVFEVGVDPVRFGLVSSLNRPGGNVTGVTVLSVEVGQKKLELLRQLLPKATNIAVLVNPTSPLAETLIKDAQAAALILRLRLHILNASSERDIDMVFPTLGQLRADALMIGGDAFFTSRSEQLATLALRHAIPSVYQFREFVLSGGLMSYGTSIADAIRQVGIYAGRVLKGERPADLPVQQATKIELIINLNTAKALGLTVPETLLATADEVIQ